MSENKHDLLQVLRFELKFIEAGGYGRSPHAPWRAPYIFEDSPTCLNFNNASRPHPCSECLLTALLPNALPDSATPCRFIPLDDEGRTVDSLYRHGTQEEIEEVLQNWLRREISRIETELAGEIPAQMESMS